MDEYHKIESRPRLGFIDMSKQKKQWEIGESPILNGLAYRSEKRKLYLETIEYYPMLLDLCETLEPRYESIMMISIIDKPVVSITDNAMMTSYFEPIKILTHEEVLEERFNFPDGVYYSGSSTDDLSSCDIFYFKDKKLHRDKLPAIIRKNGKCREYYFNGMRHRGHDLPAIIRQKVVEVLPEDEIVDMKIGRKKMRVSRKSSEIHGVLSVIISYKTIYISEWFQNGLRHRDTHIGPAIIEEDDIGNQVKESWYMAGKKIE